MPEAPYRPPHGYKTMAQAAEQIGVTVVTLRKLIQRRGVQVFQDPRDARAKLLKADDVQRLQEPIPIATRPAKTAA
jgi:hypothetical protein